MPVTTATSNTAAAPAGGEYTDDGDDLFDYNADIPDIDTTIRDPPEPEKKRKDGKKVNLGLDEDVKIRKKRINVKLDEARLMREDIGIPKLRKEAPKKLKFKGKGHEYSDAARLLSYYQLWADDLYKKAKFRDTLKIIEKLGHSKSMKDHRMSWVDESRQQQRKERENTQGADLERRGERGEEPAILGSASADDGIPPYDDEFYSRPPASNSGGATSSAPLFLGGDDGIPPDDDEFYSRPASNSGGATSIAPLFLGGDDSSEDDFEPGEDEMDILMEAASANAVGSTLVDRGKEVAASTVAVPSVDEFADELEIMAELEDDIS